MNVQQLKSMMELQALNSLGSVSSSQNTPSQIDLFQQLLNQAMLSPNETSFNANKLGFVKEMLENNSNSLNMLSSQLPTLPSLLH